jgi:hypothetical protein
MSDDDLCYRCRTAPSLPRDRLGLCRDCRIASNTEAIAWLDGEIQQKRDALHNAEYRRDQIAAQLDRLTLEG